MAREDEVLRLVHERFGEVTEGVAVGPGDDGAVLADGTVITTDTVVDGVHVDRRWSSLEDIGWKAIHAAASDIPAMGARLVGAVVAAQLPTDWSTDDVAELLDGISAGADAAGVAVVGGDITSSPTLAVTVTVTGRLLAGAPCTRSGARAGDVVAVIGWLGRAAAGLAIHQAAVDTAEQPIVPEHHPLLAHLAARPELSEAHRRPRALVPAAPILASEAVTAGIDVSDGLGRDLGHVAAASGVGIELTALPVDDAVQDAATALGVPVSDLMIGGGDDHALAITVAVDSIDEVADRIARLGLPFTVVGRVVTGSGVTYEGDDVTGLGWEHA